MQYRASKRDLDICFPPRGDGGDEMRAKVSKDAFDTWGKSHSISLEGGLDESSTYKVRI